MERGNDGLFAKIEKLLEMGRRGGTEAEAEVAMRKVHELLIKHNLSMAEVEAARGTSNGYVKHFEPGPRNQPWQGIVWAALAEMCFCKHYQAFYRRRGRQEDFRQVLIGKPANVAVAKNLAVYVVRLGERLANESAARVWRDARRRHRISFKKGFAMRIAERAMAEIEMAKRGAVTDPVTGTALMVVPLYEQTNREIQAVLDREKIELDEGKPLQRPSSDSGFFAGTIAADGVSLSASGIEDRTSKEVQPARLRPGA